MTTTYIRPTLDAGITTAEIAGRTLVVPLREVRVVEVEPIRIPVDALDRG